MDKIYPKSKDDHCCNPSSPCHQEPQVKCSCGAGNDELHKGHKHFCKLWDSSPQGVSWECNGNGKVRNDGLVCECECSRCNPPEISMEWQLTKNRVFKLIAEIDTLYSQNKAMGVPSMVLEMIENRIFKIIKEALLSRDSQLREKIKEMKKEGNLYELPNGYNQALDEVIKLLKQ